MAERKRAAAGVTPLIMDVVVEADDVESVPREEFIERLELREPVALSSDLVGPGGRWQNMNSRFRKHPSHARDPLANELERCAGGIDEIRFDNSAFLFFVGMKNTSRSRRPREEGDLIHRTD